MTPPSAPTQTLLHASVGESSSSVPWKEQDRILLRPLRSIVLLAWLVRVSAVINLIASLLPDTPEILHQLRAWMPFEIAAGNHLRMFLLSMLLFILASGLRRGKRAAWFCTIATLGIAPLLHLGRTPIGLPLMINSILIVFLFLNRRYFITGSDKQSVRWALIICPVLALALLIFGTVRLHDLRFETSGPDSWLGCLQAACELIFVHKAYTQGPQTLEAFNFFASLRMAGTSIALLGLFLTLRPVLLRRRIQEENRESVRRLIDQYGDDPHDCYALLNDKRYYFTADEKAVVPYVLSGTIAVALADPIGPPALRPLAVANFALFCRQQDWEPVFYAVAEGMAPCYREAGLSVFKIGEGARVQADRFHLKGQDFQNLRTVRNRARRLGMQFLWYDATLGIDESLEQQLATISQRWLEMKKAPEMTFDMGSFSTEDIRRHGCAIAIDSAGEPLAFATWRPFARGSGRALDLMRSLPHARNVMDFVLIESILHFKSCGITDIDLGLAPLANTEEPSGQLVAEEKLVQFLFKNLNPIYGYKSLFEFKRKYRPQWSGRYVAYRRGVHLPLIGLALVRVHAAKGLWKLFFR